MPLVVIYLFKLSVSLAVMYLFYQLLLRRLTFYSHNRWYLVGYSLLCFFIPFINISSTLEKSETASYDILKLIPTVENFAAGVSSAATPVSGLTIWDWLIIVLLTGTIIMLARLIIQFISFKKIKQKARLIADESVKFYQVNKNIIPFSFGNSIFINQELHTEAELKEIIRHEFVHVKQRHTIDIIWAEVLCILNWYNPFAWLIRKSIRQNLEFIADNRVLANGMDKKQYQYLLLKVIGNNHFRVANQFNFSSLKKRIVMMNKMGSAKVHLIRFLFVLPLMAVLLLAFRGGSDNPEHVQGLGRDEFLQKNRDIKNVGWVYDNIFNNKVVQIHLIKKNGGSEVYYVHDKSSMGEFDKKYGIDYNILLPGPVPAENGSVIVDTTPGISKANSKGYFIDIKDNKGNCVVVIKDKNDKEVKKILLTEWNKKEKYYEDLYGEILSPSASADCDNPPAKTMPVQPGQPSQAVQPGQPSQTVQPGQPTQPSQPSQPIQPLQPSSPKSPVQLKNFALADGEKPLIIVDGVEWPASLDMNLIDADKIESITVLKDVSAVDLFGDKGRNGVVIITTKKQVVKKTQP
ncbi:MAG TPA: M56 family metallopeptidase, partial [Chitinophagaceae bacterium]|nr:M56 family metallopeptidase [Chitinophagaceae bacterium]